MKFLVVLLSVCAVSYGSIPQLDGRIVGGKSADIRDFPYQASVRVYDQHICGGSILDDTTVLTAAHCVYGMDHSKYSVRVGATKHREGAVKRVSKVIVNKDYSPSVFDNDMAILKLASPLTFSTNVQPVSLQLQGAEVPPGAIAWVTGWGVTKEGSHAVPESLRAVDVAVISNTDCNRKYGSGKISMRMLCAQTLGHDSCQGDSGGPLVSNGKLIGVVSWGYGCARPQYPGVYAKVSNLHNWILDNK